MALIECSNCKKKYSDSVSNCIHCGNPTPSFQISLSLNNTHNCPHPDTPVEVETKSDEQPDVTTKFFDLSTEYMIDLEEEFLNQNEWALKYEQSRRANALFRKSCMICFAAGLVSFLLLIFCAFLVANVAMLKIVLIWNLVLLTVGIIGTVFFFIRGIRLYTCKKSEERTKQYQKWLKEQKNIIMEE